VKREIENYIRDIIDSINKSLKFVEGMKYEDFVKDDKTVFAVIRALEIIGEAVKNIPIGVRNKYPFIPWRELAGIRDKLIHQYFGVKLDVIWKAVKEEIPPLKIFWKN
jgi:uncharacterized protein with HEPN domain